MISERSQRMRSHLTPRYRDETRESVRRIPSARNLVKRNLSPIRDVRTEQR